MNPEQAIEYALETGRESPVVSAPRQESRSRLTRREEEIGTFLARGLTNRRIAEELSISERTVDTHVGRIFKKLELHSREQVADNIERRRREAEAD
jgi:DNA-binding NarL/FixJ family response regulator